MMCEHRDPDLLLLGLGELAILRRLKTAGHLRLCARCRTRKAELASVSRRIASALRPPAGSGGGAGGGPGIPIPARPAWLGLSPLFLALVLAVLTTSVATIWYVRAHIGIHRLVKDNGCLPGLPNDRCR